MKFSSSPWLAYVGLVLSMVLWASSFVAIKIAYRSYDPMVVVFGRMTVASLCFLFLMKRFRRNEYRKGTLKSILFMALCEPCLYFLFEAKALEQTTASQASIVAAMLPLMVAVAARFFLKESVSGRSVIGLAMAMIGACWLSLTGKVTAGAPNPALGNFLEFVAMICATGYVITLKRLTASYSPFFLTAIQAVVGCVFYFMLLFLPTTSFPVRLDPVGAFAIVYLGAFVTLGAYALYNFGISKIPANQASSFINLIPVFTIVFAGWILNEQLTSQQYLAACMILAGVFISQEIRREGETRFGLGKE
ncbi:MAG: DMT family transporter [Deltaproteobacteria bacterium]|nr:DMT family transporter [Deltaproteobacteria bacterium]